MIFINTRPASRAKNLTGFLQQHSVDVVDLPLLELTAKPLTVNEQQLLNRISLVNAVIMVSEEAVNFGLQALATIVDLATIAKLSIDWLAVGETTAKRFVQVWQSLSDSQPPNVTFPSQKKLQNNEGLLTLSQIDSLQPGDRLQLWRGLGGREMLADTLVARGLDVQLINFYQRTLPIPTLTTFTNAQVKQFEQHPKMVLISSLTAWQHWQQLVTKSTLGLHDFAYLVLQYRIATLMKKDSNNLLITVIDDLQPSTIYQTIQQTVKH